MTILLKTESITKDFGEHKGAFDIDIELKSGEITGFIGPNGAGKTTTMLMIAGFIAPDSGVIKILESNITVQNIYNVMPKIGFLPGEISFDKNLTAKQIFKNNQSLLQIECSSKWMELSKYLDLNINKKFEELSLGNRKKVGIVNTLMHEPKILILDEPSSGLDPLIQQKLFKLLNDAKEKGSAILLSSHVLSQVQTICDNIIMIKNGNIVIKDTKENILNQSLKVFRIEKINSVYVEELEKNRKIEKWEQHSNEILLYTKDAEGVVKYLTSKEIYSFYIDKPNLEDTFLKEYEINNNNTQL